VHAADTLGVSGILDPSLGEPMTLIVTMAAMLSVICWRNGTGLAIYGPALRIALGHQIRPKNASKRDGPEQIVTLARPRGRLGEAVALPKRNWRDPTPRPGAFSCQLDSG
jgi:hypothetical protein